MHKGMSDIHVVPYDMLKIDCCCCQDDIVVGNELRQAAFRAYASLSANDEDIRKKVVNCYCFHRFNF